MTADKDRFIDLKPFNGEAADGITGEEVTSTVIETIQVNINSKVLEVENIRYIPNITSNLLSLSWLKKQDFKMELITRDQDD